MDICNLDSRDYTVALVLLRRDVGAQEIPLDHVMRISIVNDSYEPFPRMKLIIKDPSSRVIPLYSADNNSKIALTVQTLERYGDVEENHIKTHAFNIDRVKPLNFSGEDNTYEIDAVSEYITPWLNPIDFSSSGPNTSVTTLAGNLLVKAGIPMERPFKESPYQQFYVSDLQCPVRDHINRLLDFASIGGTGFYYTWYSQKDNVLKIESTKNIMSNAVIQPYNIFAIPSEGFGAEEYYTPLSIHHTNDVSATQMNTLSRGLREKNFDYKKGEFFERRMEYQDIVNGSTIRDLEPFIDNTTNIDADINYTQMANGHNWYKDIRKSVRSADTVSLIVKGSMQREIGDLILFKSSKSLQNTFGGFWMVMRMVDTYNFGANKFEQQLVVSKIGDV
jgi:hypothetical protein